MKEGSFQLALQSKYPRNIMQELHQDLASVSSTHWMLVLESLTLTSKEKCKFY